MKNFTGLFCFLFIVIAPINFIAFGFHNYVLGGDAMNGYQRNGHFYVLAKGSDGVYYPEVTESQWRSSRFQGYSLFVTHTLGIGAILLAIFRDAFPKSIIGISDEREQIVREIRRSGRMQTEFNCSGKFRSINVWWLKVAVYPGGLICLVLSIAEFGILTNEIDGVERRSATDASVAIAHCSPYLGSPILLRCTSNAAAVAALLTLMN